MFSTHFPTYWLKCTGYRTYGFSFLNILEDKTLPLGRARKAYILKFRHIELAINGSISSKILGQCTWTIQLKDPMVGFVKKNYWWRFWPCLGDEYFEVV